MLKKYKRAILFGLSLLIAMSINNTVHASSNDETDEMYTNYEYVMNEAERLNIPLEMQYEDFCENYNTSYGSYEQYVSAYIDMFIPVSTQSRSAAGKYYYNTGLTRPAEATYGKYNLTEVVQLGDIIFEANGGFGITGHIAIVEGVYTHSDGQKFIRIIEAGSFGVKRGILDDTRYDEKAVTVLRVSGASTANKKSAVSFCYSQLDKGYALDLAKDTSVHEADWYCSEMVWAAYKNVGIDIEVSSGGEPGITPRDIRNSSKTYQVTVSSN